MIAASDALGDPTSKNTDDETSDDVHANLRYLLTRFSRATPCVPAWFLGSWLACLSWTRPVDKRGLAPQLTVRLRREGTRERTRKKQVRSVGAQALLLGGEPYLVILANSSQCAGLAALPATSIAKKRHHSRAPSKASCSGAAMSCHLPGKADLSTGAPSTPPRQSTSSQPAPRGLVGEAFKCSSHHTGAPPRGGQQGSRRSSPARA